MGIGAYNRGSALIRRKISEGDRPVEFEIMERLNDLPKYEDAGSPLREVVFAFDGKVWWVLDGKKLWGGFGYWYHSLSEAVRRWRVEVTSCVNGTFMATPL